MAQSCIMKPCVKNSKGEIVESRLYKDLLSYLPSRAEATKYYNLARNDEFLARVADNVSFDENNEIKIGDLIKEAKIPIETSEIVTKLQKEVGEHKRNYQDAIRQVVNFNKNHSFKESYMATLEEMNGSYTVKIVENTNDNLDGLKTTIENQELKNKLIYRLAEAGVDVSFIEENHSRYSTINATKNANGLYQLIEFYKYGTTPELAEEAGHFVAGAMKGTPLMERLNKLLTPEVQKEILGEEASTRYLGHNPKGEVAGILIGRHLASDIESESALDKLANRIITAAKKIFSKIKNDQIKLDKIEAEQIARQMAEDFSRGKLDSSVEQAIQENETYYHREFTKQVKCLQQITGKLSSLAQELKTIDRDAAAEVDRWINIIESSSQGVESADLFADNIAALGIANAIKLIADFAQSDIFKNLVVKVDGLTQEEFIQNLPENAAKLRMYGKFLQYCQAIAEEGQRALKANPNIYHYTIDYSHAVPVNLNFRQNLDTILDIVHNHRNLTNYHDCERLLFVRICELFYGSKYINRATRMLWGNKKFEALNPQQFEVEEAITHLFADDSLVSSFLGTMSNSNSISSQIFDKILKQANFEAQKNTGRLYGKLKAWEEKWITSGKVNSRDLYEVDAQGKLTGNTLDYTYVQPGRQMLFSSKPVIIDWHTYENDLTEQRKKWEEEFDAAHPEMLQKAPYIRKLALANYIKPLIEKWHKGDKSKGIAGHSYWDTARDCWAPNPEFIDPDNILGGQRYVNHRQSLSKDQADALSEYYFIKKELDEITGSVMPVYRAPQIRGSMANSIGNYHYEGNSGIKSLGKVIKDKVIEFFCLMPEEVDAQAAGMYNVREEDDGTLFDYSQRTRSVPLFGIHKIKDTSRLSTDLVHATLAYGAMAWNYHAMSITANALEVGMEYIENHTEEATNPTWWGHSIWTKITGRKYYPHIGRLRNYLDRYLYGIGLPKLMLKNVCISKLLPAMSRAASLVYLGGNVAGGIVNLGTGTIEMLKEGVADEFFSLKDLTKAFGTIAASALGIAKDFATAEDSTKVNLFIRHFDLLNDNDKFYANRHSKGVRFLSNFYEFSLMAPYKTGEYLMQAAPYIAMAQNYTLYDKDGKTTTLWDAYQVAKDGVTLTLQGPLFKSKEDASRYNMLSPLRDIVNSHISANTIWDRVKDNQEWREFFESKGLGARSKLDVIRRAVKQEIESVEFSDNQEAEFNNKAREVTNRMHGVYNKMDKTMVHRDLIGSMFMTMKGYALGLVQRRFGGILNASKTQYAQEHLGYSVALGGETEGTITTMFKIAMNQRSWDDASLFFRSLLLPFGKGFETAMKNKGYSVTQAKNAKRNWGDFFFIGILALLQMLTKPAGDDDEDDDLVEGHLYYLSMRLLQEQSAYNLPGSMFSEATSLFDAVPAGFSIMRDFWTLGNLMRGDLFYDYYEDEEDPDIRKFFYQRNIPGKADEGDAKWKAKLKNMTPYVRSVYWAQHPYAAASNYKYVRESKK